MKHPAFVWILSALACLAAEMEIRSYQVAPSTLRQVYWAAVQDHEVDFDQKDWLGPTVEKSPFQSRFFEDTMVLRNVTSRIGEMIGVKEFEGTAVYCGDQGRLVVRTDARRHQAITGHLESHLIWNLRTEISIYEKQGVSWKTPELLSLSAPTDADLITSLSCIHIPGGTTVIESSAGDLVVEMEGQIDGNFDYAELRLNLDLKHPKILASWKTGFYLPLGVIVTHEVGSPDGQTTFLATLKTDLISPAGVMADAWIEKEKEGFFLLSQRLNGLQYLAFPPKMAQPNELGFHEIQVPPTFSTFIATASEEANADPFAYEDSNDFQKIEAPTYQSLPPELHGFKNAGLFDIRELLRKNGISFQAGDFAVFDQNLDLVYAKVSEVNLELIDGILNSVRGLGPPRDYSLYLSEIELDDAETPQNPLSGRILRKVSISGIPGQIASFQLGEKLKGEFEFQTDGHEELFEVRTTFSQTGKLEEATLKTGFTIQEGVPLVIHESRTGTKRRAWVLTARIHALDHEIHDLLKKTEKGP